MRVIGKTVISGGLFALRLGGGGIVRRECVLVGVEQGGIRGRTWGGAG
jgi:hypothetical protein